MRSVCLKTSIYLKDLGWNFHATHQHKLYTNKGKPFSDI